MKTVVFFLEEPSAREMLQGLLPRLLPEGVITRFIVFKGKQDLEKNLVGKLRGWRLPKSVFVIIRDQDAGDCQAIKQKLLNLCIQAGKGDALVRIACRELESFFLGDLDAVEKGLELSGLAKLQENRKYRTPDSLSNPSTELEQLTKCVYQKVSGSRAIGQYLAIDNNKSHSFNALLAGIRKLAECN